jgi:hypothetical protein
MFMMSGRHHQRQAVRLQLLLKELGGHDTGGKQVASDGFVA